MAVLNDTTKLALAELAIFVPVSFIVLFTMRNHGFHTTGSLNWLFLFILSNLRTLGAVAQLSIPTFEKAYIANDFLDAVSFAPLLLLFINNLQILNKKVHPGVILNRRFGILYAVAAVASLSSFVGEMFLAFDNESSLHGMIEAQVGTAFFAAVLFVTVVVACAVGLRLKQLERQKERLIYICVTFAAPLLVVRLAYLFFTQFNHRSSVSSTLQYVIVRALMVVLMESMIAALFLRAGILDRPINQKCASTCGNQIPEKSLIDRLSSGRNNSLGLKQEF